MKPIKGTKNYVLTLKTPIKLRHIEPTMEGTTQIKELILREYNDPNKGVKMMKEIVESLNAEEFHYFFPTLHYSAEDDKAVLNVEKFNKRFLSNKYKQSYLIYSNEILLENHQYEGLVGIISIDNIKFYNRNCFVSIFINKKYRDYGIACLVLKLIKNRVFNDGLYDGSSKKCMHKIKAYLNINNKAAIKAFKKANFYKVGIYTDEELYDTGYCDTISMECINGKNSKLSNIIKRLKVIF